VRVIELEQASKAAALRAADEALTAFPRIYLDADVVLAGSSARLVIERLRSGPALAARPPIQYNTSGADPLVRSYYRARVRVPSVMSSLWGAGVYGLSAAGRARFGTFPDLVADDMFVDQWFKRSEFEIVGTEPVLVKAPRRTPDLVRILRRAYQGNAEIHQLPDAQESTATSTLHDLVAAVGSRPWLAVDVSAYLGIAIAARITLALSPPTRWARDESSRGES
jgi:hypothetical protein